MNDKDKDTLVWLFVRGLHISDLSRVLKTEPVVVQDVVTRIMLGTEPYVSPHRSRLVFERCDWSLREEWILRFMREGRRPPGDVADFLGRQPDSLKRKWKEMKARDELLSEEFARRRIEEDTTRDNSGGVAKKKQATLF